MHLLVVPETTENLVVHLKRDAVCFEDGAGAGLEIASDMGVADRSFALEIAHASRRRFFGSFGKRVSGSPAAEKERHSTAGSNLSCVLNSKSLASCRSCSCVSGSPNVRFTIRPRLTGSRSAISSFHLRTCL